MRIRRPICLICLILLAGIYIYMHGFDRGIPWPVDELAQRRVSVSGVVRDHRIRNGSCLIYLKDVSFHDWSTEGKTDFAGSTEGKKDFPERSEGIVVKVPDTDEAVSHVRMGAALKASGLFAPFEKPRCEGMFDTRTYYRIRGYEGQLIRAKITSVSKKYAVIPELLRRARDRASAVFSENMSEEDAHLMAAMTLGDKTDLESEIKELYQNAGISHVLALSGLHIASVGLALLAALKRMHLPPFISSVAAFALIVAYAFMTGMSTSTQRAMIMFGLFVAADMAGRTYDILSACALSAIVILVLDSRYIFDTGFLLSFGAVTGIVFIYPLLEDMPRMLGVRMGKNIWVRIYQSVCISLSVTLATLPVMGESFMQISLYSVFINLLVIPLMSLVLLTGFAGIITGVIGIKPCVILKIPHFILLLYKTLGQASEKIPGNTLVTGKPGKWQIITYAMVITIAVFTHNNRRNNNGKNNGRKKIIDPTGRHVFKNNKSDLKISGNKITYTIEKESQTGKIRQRNMRSVIITAGLICTGVMVILMRPGQDLEIRNVDVGQGDCALMWGRRIPVIMIDGGSSDIKQVAKYRILPVLKANRITRIDQCFLTHMDSDHVNGVIELIEDGRSPVRIREIIISDVVLERARSAQPSDGDDNLDRILAGAKDRGIRVRGISAGDVIVSGRLKIRCLSPGNGGIAMTGSSIPSTDENDCSLVLEAVYDDGKGRDFKALFTGDISENTENGILRRINNSDYLKVAHHGSRFSSSEAFLERALPEISAVSAGVENSYGHPHTETIERLNEIGSHIFVTSDKGELIFTLKKGKTFVRTLL
ncbi:MAG: ComEC/Rec2 family competence protein [Lachnospiraceae bacterium]|nr:ComEC/Rec2 family competence protein [Lachnospiraceae bacterium]